MRTRLALIVVVVVCGAVALMLRDPQTQADTASVFPKRSSGGYVSSEACTKCHPDQHSSWHASYHRTMTQQASAETVIAQLDKIELSNDGQTAQFERRGDEFWVNMVDPTWEISTFAKWNEARQSGAPDPFENAEPPPRIDAQVVMTTGSHHFQVYWVRGREGRELWQFPWRYHIAEKRWVHRKDVFLAPPEWRPGMWFRLWNDQCSLCHSTGPWPGENPETGVMENTQVAEFGIACEACHGPSEAHVKLHSSEAPAIGEPLADPIVNPQKLPHRRSSEVCGSCHSHFQHSDPMLTVHGPQFRPGDNLSHHGALIDPPAAPQVMTRFWADGTNRSGGREFSGMSQSACYLEGKMSCVSCHSMHESDPNDQLSVVGPSNEACFQCHDDYRDKLTEHTHHAADSSGSHCYNCHMPHTNYALFKAIRSHRVDNPKIVGVASNSRPNACNLCHLDQTLQWAADHLKDWYGTHGPSLSTDEQKISAGALWALKGDAGQRVIAAWHFGWEPARLVSGRDWMTPIIAELMKDPYAAVRWVAFESLRKDEQFKGLRYDFDGSLEDRQAVVDQVLELATASTTKASEVDRDRVLLNGDGEPDTAQIKGLLQQRDNRMVAGVE